MLVFLKKTVPRYIISFILKSLTGNQVNPSNLTPLSPSISLHPLPLTGTLQESRRVYPLILILYLFIKKIHPGSHFEQKSCIYVTLLNYLSLLQLRGEVLEFCL